METSPLQLIGIVFGSSVVASVVTVALGWVAGGWRRWVNARYSGLYCALAVEDYARSCALAIQDSRTYAASDGQMGRGWSNLPDLPDFENVDFTHLGIKFTARLLKLRLEVEQTNRHLDFLVDFEPEDIPARLREDAATIGLTGMKFGKDLRKTYWLEDGLDPNEFPASTLTGEAEAARVRNVERQSEWLR